MSKKLIIVGILILVAGLSNGIMDLVSFHWYLAPDYMQEHSKWWNPQISWENKWAKDADGKPIVGKPFFIGSSTFLVWLTDAWHFFKKIMQVCIYSTILILVPRPSKQFYYLIYFVGLSFIWYIGFEIFYR